LFKLFYINKSILKVKDLEYQTFLYYSDNNISVIPVEQGIYYWVYFPDIDPCTSNENFVKMLKKFSSISLSLPEKFKHHKFQGEVNEIWFNENDENSILGLSRGRSEELVDYLNENENNRVEFMTFFRDLCFSRPFYVGMTENLQSRLSSHISGNGSEILNNIETLNIKKNYIWISYTIFPKNMNLKLIKIHEEIYQRFVKPGLTKKFG
jgi:hypothetical protein